jgi:hypothetical protein
MAKTWRYSVTLVCGSFSVGLVTSPMQGGSRKGGVIGLVAQAGSSL